MSSELGIEIVRLGTLNPCQLVLLHQQTSRNSSHFSSATSSFLLAECSSSNGLWICEGWAAFVNVLYVKSALTNQTYCLMSLEVTPQVCTDIGKILGVCKMKTSVLLSICITAETTMDQG